MRITYLVERIGPYHAYRLAGIKNHELSIVETRSNSDRYAWQEDLKFKSFALKSDPHYEDLWKIILETNPEVVFISGYGFTEMLWGFAWAIKNKIPIVMLSDTTVQDEPKLLIKEKIKSFLVSNVSTALVAGIASRNYLVALGFDNDQIFEPYDIVDNDFYRNQVDTNPMNYPYFLSISRLIPYKNLDFLIDTYSEYLQNLKTPIHLVILGHGELEETLKKRIHDLGMEEFIHLKGFLINTEVRAYYQSALALVLVSKSEAWGLCINEAMSAGIPVISTNIAGAAFDLIKEGETGFTFPPTDKKALLKLLEKVRTQPLAEREKIIEEARKQLEKFSLSNFVLGFNQAAEQALKNKKNIPLREVKARLVLQMSKLAY